MSDPQRPEQTISVVEEQLRVLRREAETGAVRVRIETEQTHQPVRLEGWSESVEVERVPVNRPVQQREAPWQDGEVLVVPVYEEQFVVQRSWVLKEELRLHKRREATTEDIEVVLQRERARVERREDGDVWRETDDNEPTRAAPASSPEFKKES
jgi:uncharacterized protein (TIGR02271 family)